MTAHQRCETKINGQASKSKNGISNNLRNLRHLFEQLRAANWERNCHSGSQQHQLAVVTYSSSRTVPTAAAGLPLCSFQRDTLLFNFHWAEDSVHIQFFPRILKLELDLHDTAGARSWTTLDKFFSRDRQQKLCRIWGQLPHCVPKALYPHGASATGSRCETWNRLRCDTLICFEAEPKITKQSPVTQ